MRGSLDLRGTRRVTRGTRGGLVRWLGSLVGWLSGWGLVDEIMSLLSYVMYIIYIYIILSSHVSYADLIHVRAPRLCPIACPRVRLSPDYFIDGPTRHPVRR
jgi:hypothetical protein